MGKISNTIFNLTPSSISILNFQNAQFAFHIHLSWFILVLSICSQTWLTAINIHPTRAMMSAAVTIVKRSLGIHPPHNIGGTREIAADVLLNVLIDKSLELEAIFAGAAAWTSTRGAHTPNALRIRSPVLPVHAAQDRRSARFVQALHRQSSTASGNWLGKRQ